MVQWTFAGNSQFWMNNLYNMVFSYGFIFMFFHYSQKTFEGLSNPFQI